MRLSSAKSRYFKGYYITAREGCSVSPSVHHKILPPVSTPTMKDHWETSEVESRVSSLVLCPGLEAAATPTAAVLRVTPVVLLLCRGKNRYRWVQWPQPSPPPPRIPFGQAARTSPTAWEALSRRGSTHRTPAETHDFSPWEETLGTATCVSCLCISSIHHSLLGMH